MADIVPITTTQTTLVGGIAFLSGRELGTVAITEFLGAMSVNAAAGFGAREVALALVQTIPGYGSAISAAIAYGTTYGLGQAAIKYFIGNADEEEACEVIKEQQKVGKQKYKNDRTTTVTRFMNQIERPRRAHPLVRRGRHHSPSRV